MADPYQQAVEEVREGLANNTAYATAVRFQHSHGFESGKLMRDAVAKNKAGQDKPAPQETQGQPSGFRELVELQSVEGLEQELLKQVQQHLGEDSLSPDMYVLVHCFAEQFITQRNWMLELMGYEIS